MTNSIPIISSLDTQEDVWQLLQKISDETVKVPQNTYTQSSWLNSLFASSSHAIEKSVETSAESIRWTVNERGGLSKIVGMAMVPSQFIGPDKSAAMRIIERIKGLNEERVEDLCISLSGKTIRGAIIYPENPRDNYDKCVVYNNPNGCTIASFLNRRLDSRNPPLQILELRQCPVIMYDYRGTGLSVENDEGSSSTLSRTWPSHNTIVEDGELVLAHVMKTFGHVEMWGSSLGGGVATVATESYLSKNPGNDHRLSVTNHDSFTTTGKVVLPAWLAPFAWLFGDLNAEIPMKSLIKRNIKIVVLCHKNDFVIPEGARMAKLPELCNKTNVTLIESPLYGHANLSDDMIEQLQASSH